MIQLHEKRDDRKEAKELWNMIRSDHDSMGDCCGGKPLPALPRSGELDTSRSNSYLRYSEFEARAESSESDDGAMDYETSRPFKRCTMKSRECLNHHNKSEYECIKDFPRGGIVEIGKTRGKDAWTKARQIKVTSPGTKAKQCMSIFQHLALRRL